MASLVRVWISFADPNEPAFFKLGPQPLMIGRDTTCQIQLNDSSVSRNHATVACENGRYILHDNGSINGTLVNGEPVRKHQLNPHDTIRIGEYVFVFEENDPVGSTSTGTTDSSQVHSDTSQQQVRPPLISPQKNQPVKVIIGKNAPREIKHSTSRTIPLKTGPVPYRTRKPGQISPSSDSDLSFISFACGCAGPIAFIPAILFGHLAEPATYEQKKNQQLGLVLGYFFLVVWLIGGSYYLMTRKETAPKNEEVASAVAETTEVATPKTNLEVPRVNNGLDLLRGTLAWSPPPKLISSILGTGVKNIALDPSQSANRETFFAELRSNWTHGIIVYQPEIIRHLVPATEGQAMRFVLEDFQTKPTFWEYNSTVVPEKKTVVGPFIMPTLKDDLFFIRDSSLTAKIARFNTDRFPWHNALRGVQWNGEKLKFESRQATQLRWVVLVKASTGLLPLKIQTLEGNLTRDETKEYVYSYHPAEYIAQLVYLVGTEELLGIKINPELFTYDDTEKAKLLLRTGFKEMLAKKPQSVVEIGGVFRLPKLEEAPGATTTAPGGVATPATPAAPGATKTAPPATKRFIMP